MDRYNTRAIKVYFFADRATTIGAIGGFIVGFLGVLLFMLASALGGEDTPLTGFTVLIIVLGALVFLGCIAAKVYIFMKANAATERMIDNFIEREIQLLTRRGRNKLNLVPEQLVIAEPIFLHGPSYNPKDEEPKKLSAFAALGWIFGFYPIYLAIKSVLGSWGRGLWRSKVGTDGVWRYSLMEFTIMMFDEKQVFIYFAYVDLTTGGIFHEGTHEYFYTDLCGLRTDQIFIDVKNKGKKEKRLFEKVAIFASGCNHTSSYVTEVGDSTIDAQFAAMRNLIREKKHESPAY
ncbi:MAG: hypothetical protein LBC41_04520 [Clostridiales bacterium]|jgi:hypothetical protein|nr:hypothetical protein [Clostridiales bacterium]